METVIVIFVKEIEIIDNFSAIFWTYHCGRQAECDIKWPLPGVVGIQNGQSIAPGSSGL